MKRLASLIGLRALSRVVPHLSEDCLVVIRQAVCPRTRRFVEEGSYDLCAELKARTKAQHQLTTQTLYNVWCAIRGASDLLQTSAELRAVGIGGRV